MKSLGCEIKRSLYIDYLRNAINFYCCSGFVSVDTNIFMYYNEYEVLFRDTLKNVPGAVE